MKGKKSEVWVGVFVVVGILLLVLMTLKVEKFQVSKKMGYALNIYFDSGAGLDQSSPVRVAGVRVGEVEKVVLEQGKAKVTFRLPPQVTLYKDAKAYVKSEGFLGEKYVEITPGTPEYPKLKPNAVVEQGAPPADVEQFLSNVAAIREEIRDVMKPLGDVLKAVDVAKVEHVINNMDKFSGQLTDIAKDSKEIIQKAKVAFAGIEDIGDKVRKGEGTLGKLITDDSIFQEAKKTVQTARETVGSLKSATESARQTMETFKNVGEKVERGEGTLGKLMKDESLYQETKEIIQSTKETIQSAKEAVQTVKGIAEKVDKGEGTLGRLVNDDQLMKETEKTLKKVQKAAEGIQEQTPITVLGSIIGLFF